MVAAFLTYNVLINEITWALFSFTISFQRLHSYSIVDTPHKTFIITVYR